MVRIKILALNIIYIYRKFFELISNHRKKKIFFSIILGIVNSLVDVIALSSVFPAIYIATQQEVIQKNVILSNLYRYLSFSSKDTFVLFILFSVLLLFLFRMLFALLVLKYQQKVGFGVANECVNLMGCVFFLKNILEIKQTTIGELDKEIRFLPLQLVNFVLLPLGIIVSEIVVIVVILLGIISLNIKLFLVLTLTLFPLISFFYWLIRKKNQHLGLELNAAATLSFNYSRELINGYADIKLQNKSSFFISRLLKSMQQYNAIQIKTNLYQQITPKLLEWSALLLVIMIYVYAIVNKESKGELLLLLAVYIAAAYRLLPSLNRINSSLLLIKQYEFILGIFEKSKKQLQQQEQVIKNSDTKLTFNKHVLLDNVSLSYSSDSNKLVLKSINLRIQKGEIIGLIGKSGSGKTSLVYTLAGLLPITQGKIWVDATEINNQRLHLWQRKIAFVYQDIFLMNGTILSNIVFGEEEDKVNLNKVWDCLKSVQLEGFVNSLSQGIYTPIGENGGYLSGGQKQRLVIARALYRDVSLIIMDEATSALDEATQESVMHSLYETAKKCSLTLVLIAHRMSSLKYCNRVIHLENGQVSRELSYQDLNQTN